MSRGNWATYVVVVEYGTKGWTVGPYHNRAKAESAVETIGKLDFNGLNAWVEPCEHPETFVEAIRESIEDRTR